MFRAKPSDATLDDDHIKVSIDLKSIWHATWVVLGAFAVVMLLSYVLSSAGKSVYLIVIAFFLAAAMEPAVKRLSKVMPRLAASAITLIGILLFIAGFCAAFGSLLIDEVRMLIDATPQLATDAVKWANERFGTNYDVNKMLSSIQFTPEKTAEYGSQLAGGVVGVIMGTLSTLFSLFVVFFFMFCFSSAMPRLRNWVAGLFPPKQQTVVLTVWELLVTKVGGYVAGRFILASISATCHAIFMYVIGMPYYLALGLWTGLVAQFVPNVGTYISITLPVLVGLTSGDPIDGLWIFIFAVCYQQVENLTIEPNISARAVNVHPAVSFGSALLGVQMFGLAGGVLAVPVAATLIAVVDLYKTRYEVLPLADERAAATVAALASKGDNAEELARENQRGAEVAPDEVTTGSTTADASQLDGDDASGSTSTSK